MVGSLAKSMIFLNHSHFGAVNLRAIWTNNSAMVPIVSQHKTDFECTKLYVFWWFCLTQFLGVNGEGVW